MAYREKPAASNLHSAVEAAWDDFRYRAWDAEHEAVYGMGRFPTEWCREIAVSYRQAAELCRHYLNSKLCKRCLVRRLDEMDYDTNDIKRFLHQTGVEKCNIC